MPSFFCLWIPQFAAWTLSQSEPALQNRAFAVCERGVVVAASPLALEGRWLTRTRLRASAVSI